MQNITLDFNKLKENKLSLDDLYILLKIYFKEDIQNNFISNCTNLENRNFIKFVTKNNMITNISLRKTALLLLKELGQIEIKTEKNVSEFNIQQDVKKNVEEYRNKWRGLKLGAMGSLDSTIKKLERWLKSNPTHSIEEVLKAADLYILSLNRNYIYLQQADFFIYKKEGKEENSKLSAFIEELDILPTINWTSKIN